MTDWIARALAHAKRDEINCQKLPEANAAASGSNGSADGARNAEHDLPFGSNGSEIANVDEANAAASGSNGSPIRPERDDVGLSERGKMCCRCRRVDLCHVVSGAFVCGRCVEWRVAGCPSFTVVDGADPAVESSTGACVACGSSWAMHGSPQPATWHRVDVLDDVVIAARAYVVARARGVAREGQR